MAAEQYTYTDPDGDRLTVESVVDGIIWVSTADDLVRVPADDRREVAQAVAGDEWGVIPAAEAAAPDGALSLIADVLGTDDLGDVLPGVERLKREVTKLREHRDELRQRISDNNASRRLYTYDATCPKCADGSHISPPAQPDRDEFPRVQGTCPSCGVVPLFLGEGGHVTCSWVDCKEPAAADETLQIGLTIAQPDRPEPVDPSNVRVGDQVQIEADDGSWMVRARVADTDDPSHDGPPYPEDSPFGIKLDRFYWWPKIADATVRVLHAAEPEPDEAAAEALARALHATSRDGTDWDKLRSKQDGWRERARSLIRDHGVQVGVSE